MKIVILEKEESLGVGGIVIHNQRLSGFFKKQGHQVHIVRFSNAKKREKGILYIPYHVAEKRTFIFIPSENTKKLLSRHLKKLKPDVVHFCLGISPFDYFIPSVCHELKIPVVGIWHGDINGGSDTYSLLIKSIFLAYLPVCHQLDALVVFSQKMKDFYIQKGIKETHIKVVPNGVDTKIYKPGNSVFKKVQRIKTGVLFLGRLTLVKHPDILIESFLRLNPDRNTKLVIVGVGDMEQELQELYPDNRIIFTGLVTNEQQKADILRSCDIFVLPSLYEGMSLALLEAMSTGLSCLTTDVGASAELLGKSGVIISCQKVKHELPVALKILLEQEKFRKELGKSARKRVVKLFSDRQSFSLYAALYRETIADYQKAGCPQTKPIDLNLEIKERLKHLWQKAKELGANYLLGED